ncbi:protein-arginine deiminase family protein [uncultured Litoreibacter sp.]|uniref:protein-arginine deiminase family protein n=1 Tax=uncultured Litoreibacter sp. TaxID=1392394 RepID=UPI00261DB3BD|nr:protein-arginine deiminase family protein [uncultured Litoreibacter sp.]
MNGWAYAGSAFHFSAMKSEAWLPTPKPPAFAWPDMALNILQAVRLFLADSDLVCFQGRVQSVLNAQKAPLESELGLRDSDFIHVTKQTANFGLHCPNPGSVNMLVVTKPGRKADRIIPKPFGPVVGAPEVQVHFKPRLTGRLLRIPT